MSQLVVLPKKKAVSAEKQNIKVVVRTRPLSRQEIESNVKPIVKFISQRDILVRDRRFLFDRVFKTDAKQIEVYQHVVAPMIPDVLTGYNCTVFAYGQTGSGKTYTMTGNNCECITDWKDDLDAGIISRAATHIFELLSLDKFEKSVKVSYLELYNEEIRDLLSDDDSPLNIYNDMKGSICIQGLTEVATGNAGEICKQLQRGNIKRQTAPTLMNHQSSRSHTVFTITCSIKDEDIVKTGKINFVDLAGSENIARSGCKDMRVVESGNINRSLLTLGRVIHALADKNKKHVPYRDSKLTRILQDSLGGHTKTCIIATISPASSAIEETLSTLEYACRARDIKNSPTINEKLNPSQIIDNLTNRIKRLEQDLESCRNGVGFYISRDNYTAMMEELETTRIERLSYRENLMEKDKQIQELESEIKTKKKEYDDTLQISQKSRQLLEKLEVDIKQKKLNLKKEQFVSRTYEQEANQFYSEAQDLLKTSEILSEQTNILQRKLEKQFRINKMNECSVREGVAKVLDMLNELAEESDTIGVMNDNMCHLCKEEITEFKDALQHPLVKLQEIFGNFDNSYVQNLPIRQVVLNIFNNFTLFATNKISEIKMKFHEYSSSHQQISHELISKFPEDIKGVMKKFQCAMYEMVNQIRDLSEKEDLEICNAIDSMQEQILSRKKEEEILFKKRMEKDQELLNKVISLKQLITRPEGRRDKDKYILNKLMDITNTSINKIDDVTEKYVSTYDKLNTLNTTIPLQENLDVVLEETKKLQEQLNSETTDLEEKIVLNGKALDTLRESFSSCLTKELESINTNYDVLNSRFDLLIEDRQKNMSSFKDFIRKTNEMLFEEFLSKVIPINHEGDTPNRPARLRRKLLDPLAPREVLLEKYDGSLSVTLDEDKENHHESLLDLSSGSS